MATAADISTSVMAHIGALINGIFADLSKFSMPGMVLFFGGLLLLFAFVKAHLNEKSTIVWTDMLVDKNSNRLSLSKTGQFIGLVIGSWVVIKLAADEKLSFDLFGIYLTYCLGGTTLQTFIRGKYNMGPEASSSKNKDSTSSSDNSEDKN